ncbi:MAG: polysaccharide pyruvyl transferase family protein [Bacteroidaceae bacterium]|nr:polysaccharide pyruvyl transferase family protein [Bacteroidaceae bacterium]
MRIALITIYHVPNYGSVLQAYATQELLEQLGHKCDVIKYRYPNEYHYSMGHPKQTLKQKIRSRIYYILGRNATARKNKNLDVFRNKCLNFTKEYSNLAKLKSEKWQNYDLFVVGSDQVWKSKYNYGDTAFLLSFVPNGKKRISIASSFASSTIPENMRERYKKHLAKFDAISVRENNGAYIINKELSLDSKVSVILDPTLLLSKEEWLKKVPRSDFKKKKKYILLYMLTYAFEPRPYIFEVLKHLQTLDDYEIIALEGYTPAEKAEGVVMTDKTDASINEFIDLFANADIVVTSSFHGTAFAVNFGIPLISIVPTDKGDDRQSTLLKNLNLHQCITPIGTDIKGLNPIYNKEQKDIELTNAREKSIEWIINNIN